MQQELELFVPESYLDRNEHLAQWVAATLAMRQETAAPVPQVKVLEWREGLLPHDLFVASGGGCYVLHPRIHDQWVFVRFEVAYPPRSVFESDC